MSEYIIKAADWAIDYKGESLFKGCEEIVRCRDCIYYKQDPDPIDPGWPMMCERTGDDMVEPYGYCAWATCKCGEDIETNGCEWVVCPSCGRMIRV